MVDLLGFGNTDNAVTTRPARTIIRGSVDTWSKNCSSPDADDGTALSADVSNDILAQFRTALRNSGIVLDNADDMLWRAMQSIGLRYGVDTGAAGHLTCNYSPPVASLYAGLALLIQASSDCPGATDVTPNGLATKSLTWPDGTALATGDYKSGCILLIVYDGAKWQLLFKLNSGASGAAASFVPGVVYQWPMDTPPTGTLECNGAAVSRTTYARLFGIIGTTRGVGNGTTTFNLPDYRGEFLRGWDHGRGADPDAAARTNRGDGTGGDHIGSKQASAIGDETVTLGDPQVNYNSGNFLDGSSNGVDFPAGSKPLVYPAENATVGATTGNPSEHTLSENVQLGGGTYSNGAVLEGTDSATDYVKVSSVSASLSGSSDETRPRNVNIMFVIAF